ncbi:hypothetical protein HVIM_03983 [Roseomonas mucosa]|uniref:Uncharacterized protein n=1 Tax=Roseomonas mucosa TaxID=207340 RepID=A0A4Y1MSR3_9PROT|nr:hypothetical protein RADP37_03983 [Roseomonas mucosa]QDD93218.1 hypothetical protein HVIM_03983 [Roseomonas mucosa]
MAGHGHPRTRQPQDVHPMAQLRHLSRQAGGHDNFKLKSLQFLTIV